MDGIKKIINIIILIMTYITMLLFMSCSIPKHINKEKVEIYVSEEPMNNGEKWIIYFYEDFRCIEQNFSGIWFGVYDIFEEDSNKFFLSRCVIDDLGFYTCFAKQVKTDTSERKYVKMYDYNGSILPLKNITFYDSNSNVLCKYNHEKNNGIISTIIPKETKSIYANAGNIFISGFFDNYQEEKGDVLFYLAPDFNLWLRFSDNFDTLYYKSPNTANRIKKLIRTSILSPDIEIFNNARNYIYLNKRKNFLRELRYKKHQSIKERKKADKALLKRKEIYNSSK